jgi:hypothetical protein
MWAGLPSRVAYFRALSIAYICSVCGRVIDEFERKRSWPIPEFTCRDWVKPRKLHDNKWPSRDSNGARTEYKSRTLPLRQPARRGLPEKLIVAQLVKAFPALYATRVHKRSRWVPSPSVAFSRSRNCIHLVLRSRLHGTLPSWPPTPSLHPACSYLYPSHIQMRSDLSILLRSAWTVSQSGREHVLCPPSQTEDVCSPPMQDQSMCGVWHPRLLYALLTWCLGKGAPLALGIYKTCILLIRRSCEETR